MVRRHNIVGSDHHILGGQELLGPVAFCSIIQIDVKLYIGTHMLLELVLREHMSTDRTNTWWWIQKDNLTTWSTSLTAPTSQLLSTDSGQMMRVVLADSSSAFSGTEDSTPANTQRGRGGTDFHSRSLTSLWTRAKMSLELTGSGRSLFGSGFLLLLWDDVWTWGTESCGKVQILQQNRGCWMYSIRHQHKSQSVI